MIVVTADVGGSKTTIRISEGDRELTRRQGPGSAVRPGRTLATAATVADLIRQAMASTGIIRVDTIVVGAAGAGNPTDAEEVRLALVHDQIADRVVVTTDVMLALEALGAGPGAVLVAGTGSIAIGRTDDGAIVRQGGLGWRMGDEGSGYWIGQEALRAVGTAYDGRAAETRLGPPLLQAARVENVRDLAAWSISVEPREVAALAPAVLRAADAGDGPAKAILEQAADHLARLPLALRGHLGNSAPIPLGLAGGLLSPGSSVRDGVLRRLEGDARFELRPEPLDPLLGGPRLAEAKRDGR